MRQDLTLYRSGYVTSPPIMDLKRMTTTQLARVAQLSISHEGVGTITWPGSIDLRGLDLDTALSIEHTNLSISAPALRKECQITMENVEHPGGDPDSFFTEHLKSTGALFRRFDAHANVLCFDMFLEQFEGGEPNDPHELAGDSNRNSTIQLAEFAATETTKEAVAVQESEAKRMLQTCRELAATTEMLEATADSIPDEPQQHKSQKKSRALQIEPEEESRALKIEPEEDVQGIYE